MIEVIPGLLVLAAFLLLCLLLVAIFGDKGVNRRSP